MQGGVVGEVEKFQNQRGKITLLSVERIEPLDLGSIATVAYNGDCVDGTD